MPPPGRRSDTLTRGRSREVYLHIGAMKTGTTYLQHLMDANRDGLGAAGYLFPGRGWNDHSRAARDVLGFAPEKAALSGPSAGMWDRISAEMAAYDGRASVFSMEFLSFAGPREAARIVRSFSGADVHVVLTVRDAAATIPAQWQTNCRNIGTIPWRKFLRGIGQLVDSEGTPSGRAVRTFQRTQGIPRMLDVWRPLVAPDRLHVVTVPPRGAEPRLLWERFAQTIGVDQAACSRDADYSNPSLGHASTEILRRINVRLRKAMGKVPRQEYNRVVRAHLAKIILRERASLESPVRMNRRGHRLAAGWNETVRTAIATSGADLVGDLEDLRVDTSLEDVPKKLSPPSRDELLAAATTARQGLWELRDDLAKKATPELRERASRSASSVTPDEEGRPLSTAVQEVTALVHECIGLSQRRSG